MFYLYKGVSVFICDLLTHTMTMFPFVTMFTITDRSCICIFTFLVWSRTFLCYISTGNSYNYLHNNNNLLYSNSITHISINPEPLNRNESGRFGALKSDSTHHFFRNACTKSGSLRFSQFSGC